MKKRKIKVIISSLLIMTLCFSTTTIFAEENEINESSESLEVIENMDNSDNVEELTDDEVKVDNVTSSQENITDEENVESQSISTLSDETANEICTFEELKEAMKKEGNYILKNDITLTGQINLNTAINVNLDLNGFTISSNETWLFVISDGGHLTISNGTISALNSGTMFYIYEKSQLTINSGNFNAVQYLIKNDGGILTINDGNFTNQSGYAFRLYENSETYVYGGNISTIYGFTIQNFTIATVPVSSSLNHTTMGNYSDYKYKLTDEQYDKRVKLVWGKIGENGPKMTVKAAAIYGNFWNSETDITINSGEIIATDADGAAIYHPQQGNLTMNGGLLKGATAIEAKMGHFTFNGGYVVGNGEYNSENDYENILGGSTADGSALKFELHYYGAEDKDNEIGARGSANQQASSGGTTHLPRNNNFSLNITNGVFISENNAPITIKNWNMCNQKVDYSITGGRFSSFPKTISMTHTETDPTTAYGVPVCNTVNDVYNYIENNDYKFAPAAYYDGVDLAYDYVGKDAPYYASMGDAVADRNNDKDARAYIYYLLDNGLSETGSIDRQLQIFYNLENECGPLIPDSVGMNTENPEFNYSFDSSDIAYNDQQYVLTDYKDQYSLWSPVVIYDANGGKFNDGETVKSILATTASGLYEGNGYGYVVSNNTDLSYVTKDEKGIVMQTPESVLLLIPENPTKENEKFLGWYYEDGTPFDPVTTQIKVNTKVYAKWEKIKVDVNTSENDKKVGIKTGDTTDYALYAELLSISIIGFILLIIRRKLRKQL